MAYMAFSKQPLPKIVSRLNCRRDFAYKITKQPYEHIHAISMCFLNFYSKRKIGHNNRKVFVQHLLFTSTREFVYF